MILSTRLVLTVWTERMPDIFLLKLDHFGAKVVPPDPVITSIKPHLLWCPTSGKSNRVHFYRILFSSVWCLFWMNGTRRLRDGRPVFSRPDGSQSTLLKNKWKPCATVGEKKGRQDSCGILKWRGNKRRRKKEDTMSIENKLTVSRRVRLSIDFDRKVERTRRRGNTIRYTYKLR